MHVSNKRSLVLLVFILASHVTDVLARHHHIKLRHARHRRQHGESYLPASFVSDTNEEETGPWGPWSAPSSCSRSCGGGVAHQTRSCQDKDGSTNSDSCTGARKRFFSCNVQECPDPTMDFRAEQCAEFNNVSIENAYYDWIPYTGGPNKCELNCMPRGERFFYRHRLSVVDGTPCTVEQNDVCVEGKCRPVGCDMMLGSDAKEDKCRECGGDGSACDTVQGSRDMDDLQVGYNDILLIPAGATNIVIHERRPSNNYLAVRNNSGHYYLNGNWRIDFPRSLRFVGTVFHYERRPKEFSAADKITALGPTNEPIYIVLLYQDTNVGIDYEYSIPKRFSEQASPSSYTWVAEEFSECSASCGGGIKSRLVRCVKRENNEEVDNHLCDQQLEPAGTQACGNGACPPEWVIGDWGPCSKQCGSEGTQSRQIQCEQIISGGIPSLVDDSRCLEIVGPKDIIIQKCNKDVECPRWHIGPWKPCNRLCGKGKHTRQITCYKKQEGKIVVLDNSECEDERPESAKDCELRPCVGVDWVVSKWSDCDEKCGLTQETRTTSCVSLEGEVYPDDQCNAETKPKLVRECSSQANCDFQWYTTQWSECSAKCGTGIQTRNVFCGTSLSHNESIKKVDDGKCDPSNKYNSTKDCIAEIEECKGEWFAGPYSECSKRCGGGEMTRKVICMRDNKVVPSNGNCYENDIMFSSEVCNKQACEEDEVIVVDPGVSIAPSEEEVECEDYQNDGFDPVSLDFYAVGSKSNDGVAINDSPLISLGDTMSWGIDDMMGDGPLLEGLSDFSEYSEKDKILKGPEGSGSEEFPIGSSSAFYIEGTESLETSGTDYMESTDFSVTESIQTDTVPSGSTESTSDNTDSSEKSPATELLSTQSSTTSKPTTKPNKPHLDIEGRIPRPPKAQQQESNTTGTTESDGTSDLTSMSVSESSQSLSTGGTSKTSESSTLPDSEKMTSTTISEASFSDTTASAGSDTTESSSSNSSPSAGSDTTESSSSNSSPSAGSDTTESYSSDTSPSVTADTTRPSSSDTTSSSSLYSTVSSGSDSAGSSSLNTLPTLTSGSTTSFNSESTDSSGTEISESASSDTTLTGLDITTGSSVSSTMVSSSSETSGSSGSDTTVSSSSDMTESSSSETPVTSSSDVTESSSSSTKISSISETSGSSSSDSTISSSSDTTESSSPSYTISSSTSTSTGSAITESSSSGTVAASSSDTSGSSSYGTTVSSTSETAGSSGSDTIVPSSSEATQFSTSETSTSTGLETTESSSSQTLTISSSDTSGSSSYGTTVSSTSETAGSSSTDTTVLSSSEVTELSTSETLTSSTSETPGSSSPDTTVSSSSETTESFSYSTTISSSSETAESSGSDITVLSSSKATQFSTSETSPSSSSETPGISSSGTTVSSDSQTTESSSYGTTIKSSSETTLLSSTETPASSSSETTGSSSSEVTEVSSSRTTESSSSETTVLSSLATIIFGSSSESSTTTESTAITDITGSESTAPFEESTETEQDITTFLGETDITTESGITSDTTDLGITEADEDLDTTEQSHITDIWTTISPISRAISKEQKQLKCKPRKRKQSCKFTPFGCCYDGVKAATGPFGKGCPIPKTCEETEFGCCPDEVSPATGSNNKGCPDSHCMQTLFGCCQDNVTAAAGNDYEGCPIPCDKSEFGCCLNGKTPAAGTNFLGCCIVTTHGCCPDGIRPASGPDGEGCATTETSTVTTPEEKIEVTTTGQVEVTTASQVHVTATSGVEITSTTEAATTTVTQGEEGCENSEFGCCPDNKTIATGLNLEGCDVIKYENCIASYYGCCPDGVSPALGPDTYGCPMACDSSRFGCCDDRSTPAHGPNKEGCCLTTPYGCCPDNVRHAQGPDLYGCGCEYSRYGCCPDNTTTARGPNNEGCACEHTPHGCCPNRFTPASGPDFEGCPCYTWQFGCCPDGVSVAKGPQGQGCGCENTEFKCCSDGVTPARGENYAGCTCDASKYGCCPDGVEEAQGENFEGCLTVPSSPGAACALERNRGSCSDYTVRWFFDTEYGGCSRFWYGGCEGNDNRFKSQEECKEVCVEPKGRDACFLPKIAGPCEGYHPTWYYDTERKQCGQFVYTGCLGNANKFKTKEECEELCVLPDEIDACEQPKEVGLCGGNFTRWYFNKESDSCEEFRYGGCKGNKNNFATQMSCRQKCLTPGQSRVQDLCALEKEPGPCPGSLLRWYYDSKRKSCRQFVYGGCKGNGNKFRTYAACEQRCPVRDSCSLLREKGSCTEIHARWSFDQSENRCMPFHYTGCGGNRNNYETKDACDIDCPPKIEQDVCLLPALLGECYDYTQRWYYDSSETRCRPFYYGGCGGNGNNFMTEHDCTHRCQPLPTTPASVVPEFRTEFCFFGEDYGPCNNDSVKWFYDSRDGVCKQFRYGGCAGNENNFDSFEECEYRCGDVQDLCELPSVTGPCRAAFNRYYYDSRSDTCNEFIFGGCQGNKNNFEEKKSCEERCRKSTDAIISTTAAVETTTFVTSVPQKSPTCYLSLDHGPCNGEVTAYFYDASIGACQPFIYGGCEGNANRFQTQEQCERLCGNFQGQDVCNIQADPGPCLGSFLKFYHDPITRGCREFVYGGCDGNANRFTSVEECESVCIHREEPPVPGNNTSASNLAICKEPVNVGSCSLEFYKRFYYDDERQNCISFIYTGCSGNRNRFKNYDSCMRTCYPSSLNEVDVELPEPESQDACFAAQIECNNIRCQYGKEEYVDERNCQHCRCADPCRTEICPEGLKCAITLVSLKDPVKYRTVCRSTLKPGNCPQVSNSTTCDQECTTDADCNNDFKCCINGCGSSCIEPVPTEPLTTPAPHFDVTIPYLDAKPAAIEQPEEPNISAEEGSYVILKCACTGNPKPFITWRRGVTLIDNSVSRYSIDIEGSLQIVNLYRTDADIYTCTADNRLAAPVRIQYQLNITAPHEHTSLILGQPNYRVTVTLNSPTVLQCHAVGWPRPIVNWWHEDRLLPLSDDIYERQRDNSLRIHRVALNNLGVYTCQAYNGLLRPASWSVILQAPGPVTNLNAANQKYAKYLIEPPRRPVSTIARPQHPYRPQTTTVKSQTYAPLYPVGQPYVPLVVSVTNPSPEIVPEIYTVPVKVNVSTDEGPFPIGSEFSVACNVDGFPMPRVMWFKDNNPIIANNRITISDVNRLIITDADRSDSGNYRCQAANEYSSGHDSVDIKVEGIYIHPDCQDNSFFAKCDLIVKGKYCEHQYYAKFCCRSCAEAGQFLTRGSHINETRRKRRSILSFL